MKRLENINSLIKVKLFRLQNLVFWKKRLFEKKVFKSKKYVYEKKIKKTVFMQKNFLKQ